MTLRKSLLASAILSATLGLTACGGGSDSSPKTPENTAPTNITLSATAFNEDTLGATVGTLSATDDQSTGHTFSVDDARFEITGTTLKVKDELAFNFEETTKVTVNITVKDAQGASLTKAIELSVNDIDAQAGVNLYAFASKLGTGSSVSYSGQIARHALSAEIKALMSKLTVDFVEQNPTEARALIAKVKTLWGFSEITDAYDTIADDSITHLGQDLSGYVQKTFRDISSSGKELAGKVAGNDKSKMYKEWHVEGNFAGWNTFGEFAKTPEGLVRHYFQLLEDQVEAVIADGQLLDINDKPLTAAYITEDGLDLVQLVQKHTLGAVMFSQGTDDYLGEGLTEDNKVADGSALYTKLEHQFDEGFGYFGAARDYLEYTDSEIAKSAGRPEFQGKHDTDGSGTIDLNAEFVWGNSSNAAKRDLGAKGAATDFTAQAMANFIAARQIITDNHGKNVSEFDADTKAKFDKHVFDAAIAWEKAIAATVVHYINDVIVDDSGDVDDIAAGDYSTSQFATYAKHWGEMKGFALNFQFSPFSPFADDALNPKKDTVGAAKFVELHTLLGDKPWLNAEVSGAVANYKANLIKARDILQAAYDFDQTNVENW